MRGLLQQKGSSIPLGLLVFVPHPFTARSLVPGSAAPEALALFGAWSQPKFPKMWMRLWGSAPGCVELLPFGALGGLAISGSVAEGDKNGQCDALRGRTTFYVDFRWCRRGLLDHRLMAVTPPA